MTSLNEYIQTVRQKEISLEELRRSDQRLRSLSVTMPEPICVLFHSADGLLIDIQLHPYENEQKKYLHLHTHTYFEMIYVYHGKAYNNFADSSMTLHTGDILILNPNIPHRLYIESPEDIVFNIMISKDLFEKSFLLLISENDLFSNFFISYLYHMNQASDSILFRHNPESGITAVLDMMIEEFFNKPMRYEKALESFLALTFTRLTRSYSHQENLEELKKQQKIMPIITYIRENFAEATLVSTAQQFNYSEKYLSRLIKQRTGKSFNEISIGYKLEYARELLLNSVLPISEIAQRVGYANVSYFFKAFKKRYMQTPYQFRKSNSAT